MSIKRVLQGNFIAHKCSKCGNINQYPTYDIYKMIRDKIRKMKK